MWIKLLSNSLLPNNLSAFIGLRTNYKVMICLETCVLFLSGDFHLYYYLKIKKGWKEIPILQKKGFISLK